MAKLAVLFFAALAFQAVCGGILRYDTEILGNPLIERRGLDQGMYMGKYHGLTTDMSVKDLEIQYHSMVRDLFHTLETISMDDMTVRETFIRLIREYSHEIQTIFQWLEQVIYKTDADVYMYKELILELREILAGFKNLYIAEYSNISTVELKEKYFLYIRNFVVMCEKLFFGLETRDMFHTLIQQALVRFLNITHQFYYRLQNINEMTHQYGIYGKDLIYGRQMFGDNVFAKYGQHYGQVVDTPVEMYQQIHYIVKDLYVMLQHNTVYNHEMLTMHVRHFVKVLKTICIQLESYQHIDIIREVVYQLRDVCVTLEKLTVYKVFTNVHQIKMEFYECLEVVLRQFEKLHLIVRDEIHADVHHVVETVFDLFLNCLHDIYYQLKSFETGYGFDKYSTVYGYGKNFGYGFDKTFKGYGKDFQTTGMFNKGYGFDKDYRFGFDGLYGYGKMYNKYNTLSYGNTGLYNKYNTISYGNTGLYNKYYKDTVRAY